MKVEYPKGGRRIDFATGLEMLTDGEPGTVTLIFDGMEEQELDDFATYCKRADVTIEAGQDDTGRTHIRTSR